jgi:hypothetical protein
MVASMMPSTTKISDSGESFHGAIFVARPDSAHAHGEQAADAYECSRSNQRFAKEIRRTRQRADEQQAKSSRDGQHGLPRVGALPAKYSTAMPE